MTSISVIPLVSLWLYLLHPGMCRDLSFYKFGRNSLGLFLSAPLSFLSVAHRKCVFSCAPSCHKFWPHWESHHHLMLSVTKWCSLTNSGVHRVNLCNYKTSSCSLHYQFYQNKCEVSVSSLYPFWGIFFFNLFTAWLRKRAAIYYFSSKDPNSFNKATEGFQ